MCARLKKYCNEFPKTSTRILRIFRVPAPSRSKTACVLAGISVFPASAGQWKGDLKAGRSATSAGQLSLCPRAPHEHRVKARGGGAGPGLRARLPYGAAAEGLPSDPPPPSGTGFVVIAGSFLPGSGRAPPAAARSAGPTAHPYLGRVRHSPRGIC